MEEKRTEEQKVAHAPIEVVLGGKKYKIAPLVIRDSREWRKKAVEVLSSLPIYAKVTTEDTELFGKALNAMLVEAPDKVIDLFFSYAKDLTQKEIEAIATDSEIAEAFKQVIDLAFPLANSLVGTMERLSQ